MTTWTAISDPHNRTLAAKARVKDGLSATFHTDVRDHEVVAEIIVWNAAGRPCGSTANTFEWPIVERYVPRSQWPVEIWAPGTSAHTEVDPVLAGLVDNVRAEAADVDADE